MTSHPWGEPYPLWLEDVRMMPSTRTSYAGKCLALVAEVLGR